MKFNRKYIWCLEEGFRVERITVYIIILGRLSNNFNSFEFEVIMSMSLNAKHQRLDYGDTCCPFY